MKNKIITSFKTLFFVGLLLLFFSFFLDWYSYQIYDSTGLVVSWNYNLFDDWSTPLSNTSEYSFDLTMRPENGLIPITITILLISTIIVSAYHVVFESIDEKTSLGAKNIFFAYMNGFLLILNFCYVVVFPVMYLQPQNLHFPLVFIEDYTDGLTYMYAFGAGYVLQLISFVLIFPYSVFYFKTIRTFGQEKKIPDRIISKIIQDNQEPLDLDRYIAEEQLKHN